MAKSNKSSEADKATSLTHLRFQVAGLQAVLAGRLIEDRAALIPPAPDERRIPTHEQRAFFDLQARFGPALKRLKATLKSTEAQVAQARIKDTSLVRLRAINDTLNEITAAPAMLGVIKTLEEFPDTTVVREKENPVVGGGDNQTDNAAPASSTEPPIEVQPWDSYSPEDRGAALGYFESGTRLLLEQQTGQIVEAVHRGGAFLRPNGDLDWDEINDVISGVIFGAALGVGGAAGGALAAVAFLVVPRMLAAIEEGIGDSLIGDIPSV